MYRLASMMAMAAILLSLNASGVIRADSPSQRIYLSPDENPLLFQGTSPASDRGQPAQNDSPDTADAPGKAKDGPLQPMSRLALFRYVDGEFARVVKPIPAGKQGFHLKAGSALDEKALRMALASSGSAINPGDHAQITNLGFKDREIIIDINGGGRGRFKLRDHVQMESDGIPSMTTSGPGSGIPVNTNAGATLFLDFDKPLPDMTPQDLKTYLAGLLDFSKQHSAAVQWVESLPPDIQKAIEDKEAVVGMNHEMVLSAMGRPDRKVREKGPDGNEIEDWIYGKPPAKTIFVTFEGDKVTQVKQFPR